MRDEKEHNQRIALFPGSFDPLTFGHIEIIERGLKLFDLIYVGIGINREKRTMFSAEQRKKWIEAYFHDSPHVQCIIYDQLTVEIAKKLGARFLLRGLRTPQDMGYETRIQFINSHLAKDLETVYLISKPETAHISSTLVRELITYRANLDGLVPEIVIQDIYDRNSIPNS